jgi:DNA repair protein RecO (recombination protein O)
MFYLNKLCGKIFKSENMEQYNTLAFVLKKEALGEADRFYYFYTQKYGQIKTLARGSSKIKAKLAGHLEIPSLASIDFVNFNNPRLISALEQNSFSSIKKRVFSLEVAFQIANLLYEFTLPYQTDLEIWQLTYDCLFLLEQNVTSFFEVSNFVALYFNAQLLKLIGLAPFLDGCTACGNRLETNYFNFEKKGLVCKKHSHKTDLPISSKQRDLLILLFNFPLNNFKKPQLIKEILKEEKFLKNFLTEFTLVIKSSII